MDKLIGIIRSNGGLTARLVRQNAAPHFESSEAVAQAAETIAWYEIIEQPLATLESDLFPGKTKLLAAWQTLGQVREQMPEVVSALRLVLSETVLGTLAPNAVSAPIQTNPRTIKPTAAHPRAYQGTTHKLPREKISALADLRPLLCGTGRLGWLPELEEAQRAAEARLPELFRTSLYCLVRSQDEMETRKALALYWTLGLDHAPARLAAYTFLLSLQSGANTDDWGRFAAALPEEQRTPFLHLLIASGAYAVKVRDLSLSFADQALEVLNGSDALYRAYWLLRGLATGIEADYLMTGYRLADAYGKSYAFHAVRRSGYVPLPTFRQYAAHCRSASDFYEGTLLRLWEQCGLRPGLGDYLEKTDWTRYAPETAWRCLRLYATSWDNWGELPEDQPEAKWQAVCPQLEELEATLQSVPPEFQEKCVRHLAEYLWQWDRPEELSEHLPFALTLTRRLCRPPFDPQSDCTEATTDFLAELPGPLRARFLHAPDTSFRRLEKACRRDNDSWLIGRGTWALTRQAGEFTVCGFEECPGPLFQAAKLLGSLPGPMREAAVRAAAGQDVRLGLKLLEQETLHLLAESLPNAATADRHTLQMQMLMTDNRRALRKFLQAQGSGKTNYRQTHFLTRRWLDKHSRLNLAVWQDGISCEAITEDVGRVSLKIETDPSEVLKMGTYVGSCLGLGGSFAYSAAAAVLDINKQVVYARNAQGTVIGRQLIAISENDQLVCFEIYPLNAQKRLGKLFAEFDTRLTETLGLPLYDAHSEEDYEIACILSHDWWDDQAWDLTTEEEPIRL